MSDRPEERQTFANRLALVVSFAAVAYFVFHCLFVILGPERRLMEWLYDDALYYAIVAKHFHAEHISSFDGVTRTTGYHPLWMWLCSCVYGLRDRLDLTYLRLCMGLSATIATTLLILALRMAIRRRDTGWLWAVALAATSYSALNNGATIMEWPLVVAFGLTLHALLLRCLRPPNDASPQGDWVWWAGAFFAGVGGSMSRTDFGLVPFAYFVGGWIIVSRFGNSRPLRSAAAALLGSITGLGVVFSYNHAMTGMWLQQSAAVKHAFAQLAAPFNPVPAVWQFARVLLYLPPLDVTPQQRVEALAFGTLLIAVFVFAIVLVVLRYGKRLWSAAGRTVNHAPRTAFEVVSATVGVAGYLTLYGMNSQATYGWYTATVTVFIVVLAGRILSAVPPRWAAGTLLFVVLNIAGSTLGGTSRAQFQANETGMLMHHDHAGAVMGGGDVGKVSFYNNGELINLDGLMNNEVVPYLLSGKLPCYVLDRRIAYLGNTGTITQPLTDALRKKNHQPPIAWDDYFHPVAGKSANGDEVSYLRTDFDALRRSGECSQSH